MGFEGANVLFDSWVHPLVMGLEEHLLTMFRDDFEFHDGAGASHLHGGAPKAVPLPDQGGARGGCEPQGEPATAAAANPPQTALLEGRGVQEGELLERTLWTAEAEAELKKIPFFVRGKARRNTERFAEERGLATISLETLYDAKAHYAR
jgi:light-independent protochlorophyllide reductase subunit B